MIINIFSYSHTQVNGNLTKTVCVGGGVCVCVGVFRKVRSCECFY